MDSSPPDPAAPPVTVVMVAHNPGEWFEATLRSIADQDYPDLSVVVVDAGSDHDQTPRVRALLPRAQVRRLEDNPGYAAAANEVLGDVGEAAFLAFCHDDIRLEPTAISALIEETFRSNAGIAGPKLSDWHDPRRLLQVGMSVDKTGAPAPLVDRGELDQEQHDAVRDVFYVSGGATLVRADLFDALGGFDAEIDYLGEDLDLCWRAHVAGARVMIVPAARVGHLEALGDRRPSDDRRKLQTRHRLRTMLSCYSGPHLVRVVPQALLVAVLEAIYALLVGHTRQARDVVGAWTWNLRRAGSIRKRRREIKELRQVSDTEIRHLQVRGSARVSAYLRGQIGGGDSRLQGVSGVGQSILVRVREPGVQRALTVWSILLVILAIGSRHLLTQPIPNIAEFAAFPADSSDMMREYLSGFRSNGLGSNDPAPTTLGFLSLLGYGSLGNLGLLRTVLILGMVPLGLAGMWRLLRPTGSRRTRLVGVIAYAIIPVGYNAIGEGHWSGLVVYGLTPWMVSQLARLLEAAPFGAMGGTPGPGVRDRSVLQRVMLLGVLAALAAMVMPLMIALVVVAAAALAVGSTLAGQPRGSLRLLAGSLAAAGLGLALHLPWSLEFATGGWNVLARPRQSAIDPLAVADLLRFRSGDLGASVLSWGVLVAAALPLLIGREWRLAWAVRGWFLALAFWAVASFAALGWLPVQAPAYEVLLAPAAVGLAMAIAMGMAAFEIDLPEYDFGWRQLLSFVAGAALVLSALPVLGDAIVDGRWGLADRDLDRTLAIFDEEQADGAFRILWLGDADLLPLSGWVYDEDLSYATTTRGRPLIADLFPGDAAGVNAQITGALDGLASGTATRFGETVAPMGIRYVIVPLRKDPDSAVDTPPASPVTDALVDQLDLDEKEFSGAIRVFENSVWVPSRAGFDGGGDQSPGERFAEALSATGVEVAAAAQPVLTDDRGFTTSGGDLGGDSVMYNAYGGDGWRLTVDGAVVESAPVSGWAQVYGVVDGGDARLTFSTSGSRRAMIALNVVFWAATLIMLLRARAGTDPKDLS